jgi:hypothetical protein
MDYITGFFSTLALEQKEKALAYRGEDSLSDGAIYAAVSRAADPAGYDAALVEAQDAADLGVVHVVKEAQMRGAGWVPVEHRVDFSPHKKCRVTIKTKSLSEGPRLMTATEMAEIVGLITYKPGWRIVFHDGERPFVQLEVSEESDATLDPTAKTPDVRVPWKSGKRYLSPFMCRQEVVGAVFGLIKDAELHETHEWFRYRGASIFNPHLDPDVLVQVARRASSFVTRENAMSMEEPK